jgi:ADP-ribosylglycohydrolase
MLGAIIGDIVGSYYEVLEINYQREHSTHRPYEERIKILDKNTPLFTNNCSYTDDTVLTCAIYDAIKNGNKDYAKYLKEYGLREIKLGLDNYGRSRFGSGFVDWVHGDYQGNSYGNGSAMRISPVGYLFNSLEEVKKEAYNATIPSHNHIDAINGATAVAEAIYLLRTGFTKEEVKEYIENNYYSLDYDLDDLQHNNRFSSKALVTVPQAIYMFLVSDSFEDCIRKSISIGGDTDTIACIAGSLAESYYGVPEDIKVRTKKYLSNDIYNLMKGDYYGRRSK